MNGRRETPLGPGVRSRSAMLGTMHVSGRLLRSESWWIQRTVDNRSGKRDDADSRQNELFPSIEPLRVMAAHNRLDSLREIGAGHPRHAHYRRFGIERTGPQDA